MSIEGLILSALLALAFLVFLAYPFAEDQPDDASTLQTGVERQRERLQLYYERVLRNLHDLDEDFATGKLSEADYRPEREQWMQRGTKVLKALDELDAEHLIAPATASDAAVDRAIDQAINHNEENVREHAPSS